MKKLILIIFSILSFITTSAQINTDRVMMIGRNALYFEDYVLAIQYFNQIIKTKPYLAEPYYYRAVAKYFLDDFKGAEEDCTLSIEKNQFLYGAYQLRADSRQNQKNYKGAEEDYEMSLRQNPNDKFILINLGIVNIENKDLDKAETYLNQLVKTYPGFTEGTLTRANLYLEKADTIKAIDDINKAIENDKYFAPGYAMRASVNLMKKQYENAIEDYNKTIELDPLGAGYYINRGLAKYYTNDLRGAMSDYDHVMKTDPNSLIAHFNRALLRAQVGDDNKAIEDLNFVIKNEPDNYIAYMNRALLKTNTGDLRGSLNDLNKVLAEYPNFYQGYQFRSDIKRRQNDMRGAELDYNTAVRIENRVKQDVLAGKTPQGIDEGTKTREESDKTIDKFNLLVVSDKDKEEKNIYKSETRGKIQNKQANIDLMPIFIVSYYDDANSNSKNFIHFNKELEDLNKNTILDQKLVITNHDVQLDSTQIAERFESINSFSNLITKQPENAVLYFARGLDYMLIQDYNSAIEDFNRSIAIDPSFTIAYFNLGSAYEKMLNAKLDNPELYQSNKTNAYNSVNQQYQNINNGLINTTAPANNEDANLLISKIENDQIIDSYNKVLEISPDFIYAYYNRAEIKSIQNDIRGAILNYNEAIRKDPDFADAYYNRGINRLKINDTQRGLEDLRKAGELGIVSAYSIMKRMTE